MYYEYWNLKKPPFDNVPDPSMYTDCHTSMEGAISETLFAIEEGEECISVIVGDIGLGKTLSIRIIIDSLNPDKYNIVLITNPSTTFVQILREIIGQITGKPCEEKKKVDLLEIFNKLLFETIDEGKKVLIFIDEANAISPTNLENLRLLTNMQDDQRNLFTIVLVGQMELAKRLEHPKRANLFQRIGTYNRLEKILSEELVKAYVETRLRRAGGTRKLFTEDSYNSLWEYSEHGVPRLINKICKLSLKAGETNQLNEINGEKVRQIGERFQKMISPATPKRKPRKRLEKEITPAPIKKTEAIPEKILENQERRIAEPVMAERETLEAPIIFTDSESKVEDVSKYDVEEKVEPVMVKSETSETPTTFTDNEYKDEKVLQDSLEKADSVTEEKALTQTLSKNSITMEENLEEVRIGDSRYWINLPSRLIQQANFSSQEQRMRLAGVMAAQALKENPQLTESLSADPVPVWDEVKNFILCKFSKKAG